MTYCTMQSKKKAVKVTTVGNIQTLTLFLPFPEDGACLIHDDNDSTNGSTK